MFVLFVSSCEELFSYSLEIWLTLTDEAFSDIVAHGFASDRALAAK